jgi:site-specific DNA-methyltransferase (adenine-specific)
MNRSLFSSVKQNWRTPPEVYAGLEAEFHFTLDGAPSDETFELRADELCSEWSDHVVFLNPPYGTALPRWVRKAYQASLVGATVVCLIPSRTDTRWWHDYCMKASEIRFIRGRLKFQGATNSAPFPSAVVVFRPPTTGI